MTGCITGHRPEKLWGYNMNDPHYTGLKKLLKTLIIQELQKTNEMDLFSGMALGADQIFATAVIELRREGYPIRLHCAIPCVGQENRWSKDSQIIYKKILSFADSQTIVWKGQYAPPYVFQIRNKYMVDRSDFVFAVWDGSSGGTANCITYAKEKGRRIIFIRPCDIICS